MHILDIKMIAEEFDNFSEDSYDIEGFPQQMDPIQLPGNISRFVAWFYKKADALEYAKRMKSPILLAKDFNNESAAKYTGVIEGEQLIRLLETDHVNDEHLYCSSSDVFNHIPRIFMDIDASRDELTAEQWTVLTEHYDIIPELAHRWMMHHLAKYWPEQVENIKDITPFVLRSIKEDGTYSKISFHIHYPYNFPALFNIRKRFQLFINGETDFVFPDWWPLGKSWQFVNPDGRTKNMLDPCPWGRGVVRLPFQSKYGKAARLVPYNTEKYDPIYGMKQAEMWMLTCWTTNALDNIIAPDEAIITFEVNDDILQLLQVPKKLQNAAEVAINGVAAWNNIEPNAEEKDKFLFYLSVIPKSSNSIIRNNIFGACKQYIMTIEDLAERQRVRVTCIRHFITERRIKKHGNELIAYNVINDQYRRSASISTINYVIKHARIYCANIEFNEDEDSKKINHLYNSESADFVPIDIDEPYVRPIITDAATVILRSSMGSGKSTRVKEYIHQLDATISILFITNRRVLSKELIAQYNDAGFIHYDQLKRGSVQETPRVICQLESIHLIEAVQKFNIVILDEMESLANQLYSPTHCSSLLQHSEIFANVVREADRVFIMDAFISSKTFALVKGLRPLQTMHYERYMQNPRPRVCEIYTATNGTNATMMNNLLSDVVNGKKLYIWSGSLRLVKKLSQMIKSIGIDANRILEITSETSNKKKNEIFADVNASWSAVDYVIASPSITVGCNHNVPGHFDRVYVFINSLSTPVRDAVQAMMRCRELNDRKILISIDENPENDVALGRNPLADYYAKGVFIGGGHAWHAEIHQLMAMEQHVSRHFPKKTLLKLLQEGQFITHIHSDPIEAPVKVNVGNDGAEEKKQESEYVWNTSDNMSKVLHCFNEQFVQLHEANPEFFRLMMESYYEKCINFNHIIFDESYTNAITAMNDLDEDDAQKQLYMRWLFQTRTRNQLYWFNDNIDEEFQRFCLNGRYRAAILDDSSPFTLDYLEINNYVRVVKGIELNRGNGEAVKQAFNKLYERSLKNNMFGRNINISPVHIKRLRVQIIQFMKSLEKCELTLNQLMDCDKNGEGRAVEKYREFATFVQNAAGHYGLVIEARKIKNNVISEVQVVHLFNDLCEKCNIGFSIDKSRRKITENGKQVWIYHYYFVNIDHNQYQMFDDRRNRYPMHINGYDLEYAKYWRSTMKRSIWRIENSDGDIATFRLNHI